MNELREKLLKGMLDLVVLRLIVEKPTHGYEIIITIKKRYRIYLGPSTIYPMLCDLEKKGYIKSQWNISGRPRKMYAITEKGKTLLGCGQTELESIVKPLIQVKVQ